MQIQIKKLIQIGFLSVIILNLCKRVSSLNCYKCANYGRSTNDLPYSSTCSNPETNDKLNKCADGSYCFVSSVLWADLTTAIIRGCASSNKPYDVVNRLRGYQSQISFCNSTDFCNSANMKTKYSIYLFVISMIFFTMFLV